MKLRLPAIKDIKNKTVLVRVDYNVPLRKKTAAKNAKDKGIKSGQLNPKWEVADELRIVNSLETIKFLQKHQAKVVLMTHLGRPGGKVVAELSVAPVARYLTQKLGLKTKFVDECIGKKVELAVASLKPSEVLLLENLRFHPEEQQNQAQFARQLADLGEVYLNEAFSACHRAHASTEGVTHFLPSFAGFGLQKEVLVLETLMKKPAHPFLVIVGGAKISDKIGALENLLKVADGVLVGGGVANNFLKAEGVEVHRSYLQDAPADLKKTGVNYVKLADELIKENKTEKILKDGYIPLPKILYPIDVVAAASPEATQVQVLDLTHDMADTPHDKDLMYLDIGPKTTKLYQELIGQAKTVFWNGPLGYFEKKSFRRGTEAVALALAKASAHTIAGGGDTIEALNELKLAKKLSYISTAGSASLLFLAGEKLPALKALLKPS